MASGTSRLAAQQVTATIRSKPPWLQTSDFVIADISQSAMDLSAGKNLGKTYPVVAVQQ
jgi:hypothetical protein